MRVKVSVRLDPEMVRAVDEVGDRLGLTRTAVVELAVTALLEGSEAPLTPAERIVAGALTRPEVEAMPRITKADAEIPGEPPTPRPVLCNHPKESWLRKPWGNACGVCGLLIR